MRKVLLEVTDKNAIYVDNTRITDRSTKWGVHTTVFSIVCRREDVVNVLVENGFNTKRIDDPVYMR